jgi:archaeal type IV pilus assembly protein PilA
MSKANQAFKQNDEAVSPVIGVILMVAITVVLAAVVFVLVSNLGEGSESAPNVSFNKDSADLEMTVITAETSNWDDFVMSTDSDDCEPTLTNLGTGGTADNETDLSAVDEPVTAGDVLTLWETNAGDCDGVTFRLTHEATNSLVYDTTF